MKNLYRSAVLGLMLAGFSSTAFSKPVVKAHPSYEVSVPGQVHHLNLPSSEPTAMTVELPSENLHETLILITASATHNQRQFTHILADGRPAYLEPTPFLPLATAEF